MFYNHPCNKFTKQFTSSSNFRMTLITDFAEYSQNQYLENLFDYNNE